MTKVVIINGSGGCGKSTFIRLCGEVAPMVSDKLYVFELSTVDWVKEVATLAGWKGTKSEKDRKFLHDLKMALEDWDNSPNQYVFNSIKSLEKLYNGHDLVCFVNIREPESIRKFICQLEAQGFNTHNIVTVLVENPRVPKITSNEADNGVEDYPYDCRLCNGGTLEELGNVASDFLQVLER